ncbi:head-tail connector protein [Edwardsiella anguillarum]|uniref:head-tail connector protein n=1 Tax=Edwardsiella anguillarum TaxID=1821960 RepID=UPI00054CAFD6|nr:head-tail connector protein [Edwardsiella anguillarum]KAB0585654.1 phage gp6-like head-tail connector protein [Edwardsiella anguillarum]UOU80304.1 head-tail connector protein [Edwardsiella anguillarum]
MILSLDQIKQQLRLEPDYADEDTLLTLLGGAVQARTETYLNRKLYPPGTSVPPSDPDGLSVPDDVILGMLLLLTTYYENRSSVSEVERVEVPQSYTWLVSPYRYIPL